MCIPLITLGGSTWCSGDPQVHRQRQQVRTGENKVWSLLAAGVEGPRARNLDAWFCASFVRMAADAKECASVIRQVRQYRALSFVNARFRTAAQFAKAGLVGPAKMGSRTLRRSLPLHAQMDGTERCDSQCVLVGQDDAVRFCPNCACPSVRSAYRVARHVLIIARQLPHSEFCGSLRSGSRHFGEEGGQCAIVPSAFRGMKGMGLARAGINPGSRVCLSWSGTLGRRVPCASVR